MEKSTEEVAGGEEAARAEDGGHRWLGKPYTSNRHSIGNVAFIYASHCFRKYFFVVVADVEKKNGIREVGLN